MNMQSLQEILKTHSRRMSLMREIDLKKIAEKKNGASVAELKVFLTPCLFILHHFLFLSVSVCVSDYK